ncbi:MAG: sporulation integral membrane protein YtvI [Eubacteriales bacterium]|jgi:sporulation integral membrane protein YtvI
MLPKEPHKKIPLIILYTVLAVGGGYVFLKYLFPVFLPFMIAWVIALLLQGVINRLYEKAKIPKKLSALVLVLMVAAVLGFVCFLIIKRLTGELTEFAKNAGEFLEKAKNDDKFASKWIKKISDLFPFNIENWLTNLWNSLNLRLENATSSFLSLTSRILPILQDFIFFVPEAFMYVFIMVLSSYYFAVDFDKINRFIVKILPEGGRKYASYAKGEMKGTIGKLLRAYALIITVTFTELFIFLTLIGVKYSLVIAFFIAFIDILPVLGTGTVLVPWGLILLLLGQTGKGMAILGAYAFITIVREIIEPKIIGKSMGIHPLAALAAMYGGLKLFGITGMFFLPFIIMLVKNIWVKSRDIGKEGK